VTPVDDIAVRILTGLFPAAMLVAGILYLIAMLDRHA
jgi:hypothetical protein